MSWQLHACTSCGGDLFADAEDENFFVCLQCGRGYGGEVAKVDLTASKARFRFVAPKEDMRRSLRLDEEAA